VHPVFQYASAAITMLAYYLALVASGAPSPRVTSWSAATRRRPRLYRCDAGGPHAPRELEAERRLVASDQRTRSLLDAERILLAIAREISVLTDLPTVLDRVNSLTATALRCDFSTTLLIDARRQQAVVMASNASEPAVRAQILASRRRSIRR
jgi:hypothetical protein